MTIGTTTVPLLPLAAVVLALLLVVLVLWGVRRATRHPAPAGVPGARPPVRVSGPAEQPCAADWTGEVANGYVTPPEPVERPRTVADVVAERRADTSPIPVVAAVAAARPAPAPRVGAHARRTDPDDAPDVAAPGEGTDAASGVTVAARAVAGSDRLRIDPGTLDEMATPGATAVTDTSAETDAGARQDLSAPSDERPDATTLAALREPAEDVSVPEPDHDAPVAATAETVGPVDEVAAAVADQPLPEAAQDPVPPPWSPARSEPADTGPDPRDDAPAADEEERGTPAEPVSRAVAQALAARAVQRARRQRDDDGSDTEPTETPDPRREHPLSVVPSTPGPVVAVDARDRLLSVLLADPARAVGATEDLDDARDRIEQLGDVLRRRREDLATAVRRLHDSGLDGEQIGRLAGMGRDDVATILEARTGDDGNRHA